MKDKSCHNIVELWEENARLLQLNTQIAEVSLRNAQERDDLAVTVSALRNALARVIDNIGNGNKVSADASLATLCYAVPEEVRIVRLRLESDVARLREENKKLSEKVATNEPWDGRIK